MDSAPKVPVEHVTDLEKYGEAVVVNDETANLETGETARVRQIIERYTVFSIAKRGELWLDEKLGIETRGIDRVPEEEKRPLSAWNIFFLWWSLNCHVGVLPLGVLGPTLGLSLTDSITSITVGSWVGALCPAYCATLGPRLGLRAVAISRYSFGFHGAKLCSVLTIATTICFGVLNVLTTGQLLSAVSNYTMSVSVGCVIVAVISYLICAFGLRVVQKFLKYSWIPNFVLLLVLVAQVTPHSQLSLPGNLAGVAGAGSWLTMFTVAFANSAGWASYAADYYCTMPADTKSWKVFLITFFGIGLPTMFVPTVGAVVTNAAILGSIEPWTTIYSEHGLGGLMRESYHPLGLSKFFLVILTFSVLGCNVGMMYSGGLDLQLMGDYFHALPRLVWSLVVTVTVVVLAIAGKEHLLIIVNNFVSIISYWAVSFAIIVLIEDKWFRRHKGYNINVWDMPAQLPLGIAAILSLFTAYLCGGLMGMAQTWFQGPIARKFGSEGGDVGIIMSAAVTLICYPVTRHIERKYTGR